MKNKNICGERTGEKRISNTFILNTFISKIVFSFENNIQAVSSSLKIKLTKKINILYHFLGHFFSSKILIIYYKKDAHKNFFSIRIKKKQLDR